MHLKINIYLKILYFEVRSIISVSYHIVVSVVGAGMIAGGRQRFREGLVGILRPIYRVDESVFCALRMVDT